MRMTAAKKELKLMSKFTVKRWRQIGAAMSVCALSACTVGPDFKRPDPPAAEKYTFGPQPSQTAGGDGALGGAQQFSAQRDIPAEWWALFKSDDLNALIARALANSPTVAASQARVRYMVEVLSTQTGVTQYPQVDANIGANRQKISLAAFGFDAPGKTFSLYSASIGVSYVFDWFGGTRRELEALRADVDVESYRLLAARLTLSANVATAAIQIAELNARVAAMQEIVGLQEQQLSLIQRQVKSGVASLPDVVAQRAEIAQTRGALLMLEKARAKAQHQLAILLGDLPGNAALPDFKLDALTLPLDLPLSAPSELAHQRPDILAAESVLHRATAKIGVAASRLYPQLTLSARYGHMGRDSDLPNSANSIWSVGGSLLQPLFHGGAGQANKRAAVAAYDQAWAEYRQTVLAAFQNVADVLQALEIDARAVQTQMEAESLARESLRMTQKQYELGAVAYPPLLTSQRALQTALLNLAQARAMRLADTAALFQALGGGWWNGGERPAR